MMTHRTGSRTAVPEAKIARIAADRKWVVAAYLISVFIALPALVIILVAVL